MSRIEQEDLHAICSDIKELAQRLAGSTLLITGGAGFLGNYFIGTIDHLNKNFLDRPCRIISVDNFITGVKYRLQEGPNFKTIKHDVREPFKVEEPVDYLIHAAGIASPKFYRQYKLETIDVATTGTRNMLELARQKKVKSFLYFSSSEVYGDPDPAFVPTPETYHGNVSPIGPRSNYDESKRLGETLCMAYYEVYGVPVKMVRPFNVYGPGMRLDDYRVIPNFTASLFAGKPIPVYGQGHHTRTFCYISDAITGFLRTLLSDKSGEVFNIGNDDREVTMLTLARTMAEIHNPTAEIHNIEGLNDAYSRADPHRRCPELTKAKTNLGYNPKVELRDGLKRFIDWAEESYKKN